MPGVSELAKSPPLPDPPPRWGEGMRCCRRWPSPGRPPTRWEGDGLPPTMTITWACAADDSHHLGALLHDGGRGPAAGDGSGCGCPRTTRWAPHPVPSAGREEPRGRRGGGGGHPCHFRSPGRGDQLHEGWRIVGEQVRDVSGLCPWCTSLCRASANPPSPDTPARRKPCTRSNM